MTWGDLLDQLQRLHPSLLSLPALATDGNDESAYARTTGIVALRLSDDMDVNGVPPLSREVQLYPVLLIDEFEDYEE